MSNTIETGSTISTVMTTPRSQPGDDEQNNYTLFIMMDDLLDKLKMLNYEDEFIKHLKMRPLNRHYFAVGGNPGEQFYLWSGLCWWLLTRLGRHITRPQEHDDPNSTIATIMELLRSLEVSTDFSPNKLKKGWGLQVIQTLSNLVDKVFSKEHITYKKPVIAVEEEEELYEIVDEEVELVLDKIEEEVEDGGSDGEEEDIGLSVDELGAVGPDVPTMEILPEYGESLIEWREEVERVTPALRVSVLPPHEHWRSHLHSIHQHRETLRTAIPSVMSTLGKLTGDMDSALEKAAKRERLLNSHLQQAISNYSAAQDELSFVNEKYNQVNGGVVERQKKLNNLTDSLETVKQQLEERGQAMADQSPVVNLRKSIKEIKREMLEMNMYIAVSEHMVISSKLSNKSLNNMINL